MLMAQATLDQVIHQLDILQAEELDQLEQAIQERRAATEEAKKKEVFHQALLAAGLITHILPPRDPSKAERPVFEVLGEPLSETIIRERR